MAADLDAQFVRGREAFSRLVGYWLRVNNWTYRDLAARSDEVTDRSMLHQSQISMLKSGKLLKPSFVPIYCLAVINNQIASGRVPDGARAEDWEGLSPVLNAEGKPLTFSEMMEIFSGARDYVPPGSQLSDSDAAYIAPRLGRMLRREFLTIGQDQIDEIPKFVAQYLGDPTNIRRMILGEIVWNADDLLKNLEPLLDALTSYTGQPWDPKKLLLHATALG